MSKDFFGTAYGQSNGKYDGFHLGEGPVSFDDTLLLIEPEAAKKYALKQQNLTVVTPPEATKPAGSHPTSAGAAVVTEAGKKSAATVPGPAAKPKSFRGSVEVSATLAKSRLNTIAEEVIALLASDPNATLRITLEIDAEFPNGASDTIKRGVSENDTSLGFKSKDWE